MRTYILDDNMNPIPADTIDAFEWIGQNRDKHRVAKTTLSNGTRISTVFLTLDHNYFEDEGAPILWETMAFPEDSYAELACQRYRSYEEAVEGHKEMVERMLREAVQQDPNGNVTQLAE